MGDARGPQNPWRLKDRKDPLAAFHLAVNQSIHFAGREACQCPGYTSSFVASSHLSEASSTGGLALLMDLPNVVEPISAAQLVASVVLLSNFPS